MNVAPVDRYLHSLLQHNKLWRLTGTDIIAMCDYEEMKVGYDCLSKFHQRFSTR